MNTSQINETFQLRGHTRIWKNDELVFDKDNAIVNGGTSLTTTPDGLKAYLAQCLYGGASIVNPPSSPVAIQDRAINTFFETSNDGGVNYQIDNDSTINAGFVSKDGIIIGAVDGPSSDVFVMVTTAITKTQSYGRKWKGTFTATGARQFSAAALGHGLVTDGTVPSNLSDFFGTPYAQQSFTTITLASSDTLTIEWEVYIA